MTTVIMIMSVATIAEVASAQVTGDRSQVTGGWLGRLPKLPKLKGKSKDKPRRYWSKSAIGRWLLALGPWLNIRRRLKPTLFAANKVGFNHSTVHSKSLEPFESMAKRKVPPIYPR